MKKKLATLGLIAVLSLSMASLASAAGVVPQACGGGGSTKYCYEPY